MDDDSNFYYAVDRKDITEVKKLLSKIDPNKIFNINTLIRAAKKFDSIEMIDLLLKKDKIDLQANDYYFLKQLYVNSKHIHYGSLPIKKKFKQLYNRLFDKLDPFIIRNITDIDNLYNECLSKNEPRFILIKQIYDPLRFLISGFMPFTDENNFWQFEISPLEYYINGMNIESIEFLMRESWSSIIKRLSIYPIWVYKPISYHIDDAIETAYSLPLLLYTPELVYKISNRPITDMSLFRGPMSHIIKKSQIKNNKIIIDNIEWNVIPVTRYAKGMSKGLYFNDSDDENECDSSYCGTFYYYEPESTTYLCFQTERTFFNKYDVLKKFYAEYTDETLLLDRDCELEKFENDITDNYQLYEKYYNQEFPSDLKLTPLEISNLIPSFGPPPNDQTKIYAGKFLGLYGVEDIFDQYICKLAKNNNIDILILTDMIGSHQIVTEILDSRDRADSLKSLLYLSS